MGRRSAMSMVAIERSNAIYFEMEKCSDELTFQRLLEEDDALKVAAGQPRMRPRSMAEFRQPFSGVQDCSQYWTGIILWSDDDYDAYDAMVAWAKESTEWQSITNPPAIRQLVLVRIERKQEFDRFVLVMYFGEKTFRVRHPNEEYRPDRGDRIDEWLNLPAPVDA